MVGLVSGLAAACSTDSARLAANPFSNPFAVSSAAPEPTATGALPSQPLDETMPAPAMPAAAVTAQPLAAPVRSVAYNQPAPAAPRAPVAAVPAAPRSVASAGPAGWSPQGGSTVTVGQGDSLQAISTRYGVPAAAILQANGLSTASQVAPGRTLVIPVFNAVGAPVAASAPARPAPAPQPQMRLVEGAKPVPPKAVPSSPARVEAKPAPKAAPEPKRVEPAKASARPAPVAAKPEPVKPAPVKTAPVKTAQAAPVAAKPEPKKPEPKKPEPKAPEAVKPVATRPVETPKTVVQAQPKPEPQPQPQKVASLGAPPISAPAIAPTLAPAPQPAKPEPERTASLPAATPAPDADFRWPARGRVISGFGTGGNEGINISVPEGTPVRAAEGGTVAYAGSELKGYGNLVLIRHDNGYVSAYAHNGALDVKRGEKVKRGQVIAKSGQSGNVNAPQLHFELRKGSTPIDPMPYLSN